jgi:hypothetical protein
MKLAMRILQKYKDDDEIKVPVWYLRGLLEQAAEKE